MDGNTEVAYRQVMLDAVPTLDRWRRRVQQLEQPERGSELHADDQAFPEFPISQLARQLLAFGGEHLRLAVSGLSGGMYPSAHYTVLRGALVGSAQAVWILAPDDSPTRRERGMRVLGEAYKQLAVFHRDTRRLAQLDGEQRQELDDHVAWIGERAAKLGGLRTSKAVLNLTSDVIPEAAAVIYRDQTRRVDAVLLWRQMSGDAHSMSWPIVMRAQGQVVDHDRRTGMATFAATGTMQAIAQPFKLSLDLLQRGWSLFDRRCEGR